jgi:(p)ppGpp synthase/HD superfamily hydrolase
MATIEKALQIAARAHEGQVDKHGQPYIRHPPCQVSPRNQAERRTGGTG